MDPAYKRTFKKMIGATRSVSTSKHVSTKDVENNKSHKKNVTDSLLREMRLQGAA